jgi:hypothetical protein
MYLLDFLLDMPSAAFLIGMNKTLDQSLEPKQVCIYHRFLLLVPAHLAKKAAWSSGESCSLMYTRCCSSRFEARTKPFRCASSSSSYNSSSPRAIRRPTGGELVELSMSLLPRFDRASASPRLHSVIRPPAHDLLLHRE